MVSKMQLVGIIIGGIFYLWLISLAPVVVILLSLFIAMLYGLFRVWRDWNSTLHKTGEY